MAVTVTAMMAIPFLAFGSIHQVIMSLDIVMCMLMVVKSEVFCT